MKNKIDILICEKNNHVKDCLEHFKNTYKELEIGLHKNKIKEIIKNKNLLLEKVDLFCVEINDNFEEYWNFFYLCNKKTIFFTFLKKMKKSLFDKLKSISLQNTNILSIIDIDQDPFVINLNFRSNIINILKEDSITLNEMNMLKDDVNQLCYNIEHEFFRIKKIHEKIGLRRCKTMKGVNVISKYSVGNGIGGEFLDFIHRDREMLFILSSCNSYLVTGLIIQIFTKLKTSMKLNEDILSNFTSELICKIQNMALKNLKLHLLVGIMDTTSLNIRGKNIGNSLLMSSKGKVVHGNHSSLSESLNKETSFHLKLSPGEKLILISPGTQDNFKDSISNISLLDFMKIIFDKSDSEIVNEIFYQIKKDKKEEFPAHDSSIVLIRVNDNVIFKI